MSQLLTTMDDVLYYPILIIVLLAAGLFFTFRTRLIQFRWFRECIRVVMQKPSKEGSVSSFQALMVSTASRVGTGNIIGISTALCLGGFGAVFWMWAIAIIGGATAFIESTLAQVYKRRDANGDSYGGPAYYIEIALHNKLLASAFAFFLIITYAGGFNALASYNLQSTFSVYGFYDKATTPWLIGGILAILVGYCLVGGGKRIMHVTEVLVPFMGVLYVLLSLVIIVMHLNMIPSVLGAMFADAFDFQKILGGISGSCMMYGIKRGLYSNEAGVGSAPNAAAAADVSHPAQQGLVQMLSVFIDTLLCTSTALMCMFSGVVPTKALAGAPYVQKATQVDFGTFGPIMITVAMVLFAFTTLIGNLFYVDNCLAYLNGKKKPSDSFMKLFKVVAVLVIFVGAGMSMDNAWAVADICMAFMCLINIPSILALNGTAIAVMDDYGRQLDAGVENPVFKAKNIGLDESDLEYWK
ncbi:sodium:alanine symporter family protein [Acidaminococcus timonensis]|uniref:alanine/glycine:cation symporter family protein n=1 Tax=Acidaminococcus TaxID=904 RepID=UPI0026ED792F|nr:alanine/glycine:cation symporter family protein [Acidaminococcus timonensis]